jgi:hypothetical protein
MSEVQPIFDFIALTLIAAVSLGIIRRVRRGR